MRDRAPVEDVYGGIGLVDLDGVLRYANRRLTETLGRPTAMSWTADGPATGQPRHLHVLGGPARRPDGGMPGSVLLPVRDDIPAR